MTLSPGALSAMRGGRAKVVDRRTIVAISFKAGTVAASSAELVAIAR